MFFYVLSKDFIQVASGHRALRGDLAFLVGILMSEALQGFAGLF